MFLMAAIRPAREEPPPSPPLISISSPSMLRSEVSDQLADTALVDKTGEIKQFVYYPTRSSSTHSTVVLAVGYSESQRQSGQFTAFRSQSTLIREEHMNSEYSPTILYINETLGLLSNILCAAASDNEEERIIKKLVFSSCILCY